MMCMEKSLRPGEEFLLGSLIYWGLWIAAVHREKTACVRLGPKGAGSSDSCTRPSVASLSSFVAFFNEENPRETMAGCGGSGYPVKTEGRMLLFFAKNSSVILNSLNSHICKKNPKDGEKGWLSAPQTLYPLPWALGPEPRAVALPWVAGGENPR